MTLDPASLQVLVSRLVGVADEMGAVLRRAAFSPNIKERADCSAALFDADGELLIQAEHIPVHLGSMPASVRAAIDALGSSLQPGDQVILNDPFAGGTHLNDITLVAPCFFDGTIVGWAANRAHHADVGGAAPGSIPADATDIAQEGLRIPPVVLTPSVRTLLFANSRTPEERTGDLDAQVGANVLGVDRLAEIVAGGAPLHEVADYAERRMRAALADMPNGAWTATDVLDSTGPGHRPAVIAVRVTIDGEAITFDFTGTDAQRAGNVNAVEAVTMSCVAFALRSVTDPTIPASGGALRPVHVHAPSGSLVAATPPVAVGAGNVEVSQRIADVCLRALAQCVPDRVGAASQGTMNNVLIGGDGWVYYETVGGGQGGRPGRAGMSAIHTGMTNTANTPSEALERAYAMRVQRYRVRRNSGGAGLFPGGDGIERDLEMLEDVTVSLITERRDAGPWGLAGGAPGSPGENWLLPGGEEANAQRLPDKCTVRLAAGDVLRMRTPGGGGWGPVRGSVVGLTVLGDSDGSLVRVVEYDPLWRDRFAVERARIAAALGDEARHVEHVGSTAVPGLAAKPIVDISVAVDDPDDDVAFLVPLTRAGYVLRVIEPGHRMFRSPQHDVHVHVWLAGSDDARDQLVFRDWLRTHDDDRANYEAVKRELAAREWEAMQDYADAKTDVVREIMRKAASPPRP
ncbi:MAG TPA: hydantoinase B/oxoprolinase family protein [Acidimicrobiales bacterium]|nr:hydantoinase B/oxoprolinase family protein [Acidimicrobiales bacterium]